MNNPDDIFVEFVKRWQIAADDLTQSQLANALRQAMPDFRRNVHVHSGGQQVVYLPGSDADRWRAKYLELIDAVEYVPEGETPHQTALRYLREREGRFD
jgi:phage pi2 protein 07